MLYNNVVFATENFALVYVILIISTGHKRGFP